MFVEVHREKDPFRRRRYRVLDDHADRAAAGVSRGGIVGVHGDDVLAVRGRAGVPAHLVGWRSGIHELVVHAEDRVSSPARPLGCHPRQSAEPGSRFGSHDLHAADGHRRIGLGFRRWRGELRQLPAAARKSERCPPGCPKQSGGAGQEHCQRDRPEQSLSRLPAIHESCSPSSRFPPPI